MLPRKTKAESKVRCAIYGRVSTAEQNVEVQVTELRALAAARGWEIVKVYTDVGISGAKASRPGLDAMLADAESSRYDTLLTWKIDRVGRSLPNLLQVLERLTAAGVAFESLQDPGLSTTSASGNLMVAIIGAFAAYERNLLIERTKAGVAMAKSKGKHCGRPQRALDLRAANLLLEQGQSVRAVATMLGVPRATLQRRLDTSTVAQKSPSANVPEAA
jgi:DNA invertase Pin-like site-specific DNA recombinase